MALQALSKAESWACSPVTKERSKAALRVTKAAQQGPGKERKTERMGRKTDRMGGKEGRKGRKGRLLNGQALVKLKGSHCPYFTDHKGQGCKLVRVALIRARAKQPRHVIGQTVGRSEGVNHEREGRKEGRAPARGPKGPKVKAPAKPGHPLPGAAIGQRKGPG